MITPYAAARDRMYRVVYDVEVNGGDTGDPIGLGTIVPANVVITRAWMDIVTGVTLNGGGTVALNVENPSDLFTPHAAPSPVGRVECEPDGTIGNMIRTTEPREVSVTIAGNHVLTGKFIVFIEYVMSDEI